MRRLAKSIQKEAKYVHERSRFMSDMNSASQLSDVREAVLTLKERPKVGKRLVKVGAALVLSPEPFGDIPGGVLIASGLAMAKYRDPAGIADIKPNIRKILKDFESGSL
jgi:hypothetical protein